MSRWNETYQTHQYRSIWQSLKEKVHEQQVDDRSVETSAAELDRLKRVIEYLDELIESIDPELVPLSTWDQFLKQAQPCFNQVVAFESDRNITHVTEANNHADNLLTYVRPYMVLPKDAATSLKRAATVQVKATEKEMAELVNDAKERLAEVAAAHQKVGEIRESSEGDVAHFEKLRVELLGDDANPGLSGRVVQLASDIKSMHEELSKLRNEALGVTPEDKSLKSEIVAVTEFARSTRKDLTLEAEELAQEMEQIREFHTRAFGTEPDTGEHVTGMEDELKGLLTRAHLITRYWCRARRSSTAQPSWTKARKFSDFVSHLVEMRRQRLSHAKSRSTFQRRP